jgi:Flp pilus assembly protein TadG
MKILDCLRRCDASTSTEFAMVGPMFIGIMMAVVQGGLLLWTQLGLEHAVEAAARCSAVNSSTCGSASDIQSYAATQAYGLNLPASVFLFTQPSCGNMVSASYSYSLFSHAFKKAAIPLNAQACFPTS